MLTIQSRVRQCDGQRALVLGFQSGHLQLGGTHGNGLIAQFHLASYLHDGIHGQLGGSGLVDLTEEHALDRTFHIFNGHNGPWVALLGHTAIHAGD